MFSKKMKLCILLFIAVSVFFLSSCKGQIAEPVEETAPSAATQPVMHPDETWEFSYASGMEVYYSTVDFTAEEIVKTTQIQLTEDDARLLVEHLNLYKNSITKDVLKSEFYSYYTIELNSEYTFIIDADLANYSRDISYMFINVHQGGRVSQYGTYVDASLVTFLSERSE